MALNGPDYAGPSSAQFNALVNTKAEVEAGQVKAPDGTRPLVVEPGDNLSAIAARNGTSVEQLLKDNPQWSLDPASHPGTRDADLIYPGEVVFVRPFSDTGPMQTSAAGADGKATFQNQRDGAPVGEPYQAKVAPNGYPADSEIVTADGLAIRTDAKGEPLTGTYRGSEQQGTVQGQPAYRGYSQEYVDGVPTGPKHYSPGKMF